MYPAWETYKKLWKITIFYSWENSLFRLGHVLWSLFVYPLVNVYITMENHHFLFVGKLTISMAMFYVAFCMFTGPGISIIYPQKSH